MKRKFVGSTIALVVGIISFLGSISQIATGGETGDPFCGLFMILGSLAYISLKRRRLGLVKSKNNFYIFEILALGLMVSLWVFQNDLLRRIEYEPVAFIVICVSLIAYSIIYFRKPTPAERNLN